mmetsp:Transcript_29582/g.27007  ORF Transcript_29582/g.27007 Transcript_29582/m.27007 type:complete len:135 (+) Transcript_29582:56-460(+)
MDPKTKTKSKQVKAVKKQLPDADSPQTESPQKAEISIGTQQITLNSAEKPDTAEAKKPATTASAKKKKAPAQPKAKAAAPIDLTSNEEAKTEEPDNSRPAPPKKSTKTTKPKAPTSDDKKEPENSQKQVEALLA